MMIECFICIDGGEDLFMEIEADDEKTLQNKITEYLIREDFEMKFLELEKITDGKYKLKDNGMIKLCEKYNLDARNLNMEDALITVTINGDLEAVKLLLSTKPIIYEDGCLTPIVEAAAGGHLDIVKYLLDSGYDLMEDGEGRTALFYAARYGHEEVVKYLLEIDDSMKPDDNFNTPLSEAVINGHYEIVKRLLDAGAKMVIDGNGDSPLDLAIELGHTLIAMLIKIHFNL